METLCATGICVSELRYITVEAALAGRATITLNCDSPVTRQKVTRLYKQTLNRTEQAFWSAAVRFFHRVECQSAQALTTKSRYSKKFREEHEEEILLHQAAKNAFDEMGVKKLPKVKDLQAEYAKLLEEKKKTYAEYRRSREEMRELLTAKANVDRLLKMDEEQKKEQEKDHGQR